MSCNISKFQINNYQKGNTRERQKYPLRLKINENLVPAKDNDVKTKEKLFELNDYVTLN